jgi:hypothetical protein
MVLEKCSLKKAYIKILNNYFIENCWKEEEEGEECKGLVYHVCKFIFDW